MTSTDQDIGRLQGIAEALKEQLKAMSEQFTKQVEFLRRENEELRAEVSELKNLVAELRGGSRVVLWLGGLVGGGIAAMAVKWIPIILAR